MNSSIRFHREWCLTTVKFGNAFFLVTVHVIVPYLWNNSFSKHYLYVFLNTPKQNSPDYMAERDAKLNRVFSKFKTKKDNSYIKLSMVLCLFLVGAQSNSETACLPTPSGNSRRLFCCLRENSFVFDRDRTPGSSNV